jgi:GT2 family glycosyltransferase
MTDSVTVVIPTWNGKHLLDDCLRSLQTQTQEIAEIIVVDNGSHDGTAEYLEETWPNVTVICNPRNLGFAGGVNIGIRAAKTPFVALLNNDAVADQHWIEMLMKRISSEPKTGIVTSKMRRSGNVTRPLFDSTGDFYYSCGRAWPRGRDEQDTGQYDNPEEVFGASGGASLYRKEMLDQIGLFDERFFAYYEDIDISFRARLAGWSVWYEPKAIVVHEVGATSGGGLSAFSRYHSVKNFWFTFLKNMPTRLFWKYLPFYLFLQLVFLASSMRQPRLLSAHLRGICDAIFFTIPVLVNRIRIQHVSTLSSVEVDRLLMHGLPPRLGPGFYKLFGWMTKTNPTKPGAQS